LHPSDKFDLRQRARCVDEKNGWVFYNKSGSSNIVENHFQLTFANVSALRSLRNALTAHS
jgi:hypothetical protein